MIEMILKHYPDLFPRLHETMTEEAAFDVFRRIADTYAPSGTLPYTRGPVLASLLAEQVRQGGLTFHANYRRSGNVAIELGRSPRKPVWLMAHADICSYLTREHDGRRYRITPFCEPRKGEGRREAIALAYDEARGTMAEIARGELGMDQDGWMWFETDLADLPPFTRVCYASEATWDRATGLITGYVDDGVGTTALVLAAKVLSRHNPNALLALTDEEEGVVASGNQTFSRGSARLFARTATSFTDLGCTKDLFLGMVHERAKHLDNLPSLPLDRGLGQMAHTTISSATGHLTQPKIQHEL